jgi:hypothetical protein
VANASWIAHSHPECRSKLHNAKRPAVPSAGLSTTKNNMTGDDNLNKIARGIPVSADEIRVDATAWNSALRDAATSSRLDRYAAVLRACVISRSEIAGRLWFRCIGADGTAIYGNSFTEVVDRMATWLVINASRGVTAVGGGRRDANRAAI